MEVLLKGETFKDSRPVRPMRRMRGVPGRLRELPNEGPGDLPVRGRGPRFVYSSNSVFREEFPRPLRGRDVMDRGFPRPLRSLPRRGLESLPEYVQKVYFALGRGQEDPSLLEVETGLTSKEVSRALSILRRRGCIEGFKKEG